MFAFVDYNINKYLDSILEVKNMQLDGILNTYHKCKRFELNETVEEYLKYINEEPFYVPPTFNDVKTDIKQSTLNPKFLLFSAPGATGKSSLARHIAYQFNGIYWNLAKVKIGTNSFIGSILNAVGATKYSEFINDLNSGNVLLVIDAFDEAEIVSGRRMLNSFLSEISESMPNHQKPTVILLARTETAQYIASFCTENSIPLMHYEIGFFNEDSSKDFIVKSVVGKNPPTKPDFECASSYYEFIKNNITENERISFLGYAPVLEAISTHIRSYPNRQKLLSELAVQKNCVAVIMNIMDDLLQREQTEKVIPAFKKKCMANHPEFVGWDKVYSVEEQLVRIIYYVLFGDTVYSNYELDFLPPQLVDDYQLMLDTFLEQHPFVRKAIETLDSGKTADFTGPAFRDYTLAKIIQNEKFETLADTYFDESQTQSFFPSQIFFDCYMSIADNIIQPNHISYVYDSFRAKATAYERTYLQCSELPEDSSESAKFIAVFDIIAGKNNKTKSNEYCASININKRPLQFNKLINVSIDAPHTDVYIGRQGIDTLIYNSSVVSNKIFWSTKNITIESYAPEGCLLVAQDGFAGESVSIDIAKADNLKVYANNLNNYFKFIPYKYDLENTTDYDIVKFIHSLRCILAEFRTHRKDTLAKTADRIEFVVVGNSPTKRQALDYLKHCSIIYSSKHLYKIVEEKMQEKGINFNALARMDTQQMNSAFLDFCQWKNINSN